MISEKDCKTIIKNYLRSDNFKIKDHEFKPISQDTEGFMGEHYKLIIKYEVDGVLKDKQFFIKTKPRNPAQDEMTKQLGMFKREIFAFDTLFKEFEKYGYGTDFAPASYLCIADTALVFEDLTLVGYSITERHEAFSLEHCKCALDALAAYHAAGYAYQWTKTMEGGANPSGVNSFTRAFRLEQQYPETLEESFYVHYINPEAFAMNWWRGSRTTLLKLFELLQNNPRFCNFEALYNNYKFGKVFTENHGINKTCGHGDLWSNNLMFKYENNKPIKCRLLDFQITRCFYPALDVILVIFCNTNAEFRKKHLQNLYKYYFDSLTNFLRKYNCPPEEIHPWEHFLHSVKIVMPDALTQVILVYCIVNLPVKKLSNMVNKEENGVTDIMFNNCDLVVEAFKTDEVYKNKLLEVLEDFYDVLANV